MCCHGGMGREGVPVPDFAGMIPELAVLNYLVLILAWVSGLSCWQQRIERTSVLYSCWTVA
jgi:hypothetical protein